MSTSFGSPSRALRIAEEILFRANEGIHPDDLSSELDPIQAHHISNITTVAEKYKSSVKERREGLAIDVMKLVKERSSEDPESVRFFRPRECPKLPVKSGRDQALALLYYLYLPQLYHEALASHLESMVAFEFTTMKNLEGVISTLEEFDDIQKVFWSRTLPIESKLNDLIKKNAPPNATAATDPIPDSDTFEGSNPWVMNGKDHRERSLAKHRSNVAQNDSMSASAQDVTEQASDKLSHNPKKAMLNNAWYAREWAETRSKLHVRYAFQAKKTVLQEIITDIRNELQSLLEALELFSHTLLTVVKNEMVKPGADIIAFHALQSRIERSLKLRSHEAGASGSSKKRARDGDSSPPGSSVKR
jgi:hypothetical protein